MCTVLLRFAPDASWPLLVAAVRDEFLERAWDPPARHWPASAPDLLGGLDRAGHGTWLAARPPGRPAPRAEAKGKGRPEAKGKGKARPKAEDKARAEAGQGAGEGAAVAALLNGVRLPPPTFGARPTRGGLPLTILTGRPDLAAADLAGYDGFHLLLGDADGVVVWTWDGEELTRRDLTPGHHIIVNAGVDRADSPLVAHHGPILRALAEPDPAPGTPTASAWGPWVDLLRGDGLPGDDPRALIVRHTFTTGAGDELTYGSSSASLIAIGRGALRFDFTATPADPQWSEVAA